uniref:NADH-ubiquinone oxidoreductase chain 5 n=1 Tax=Staphylinidae sp. 2 EF-2015 TaxID=1759563 RepID=A0A0S2M7D4_9COLE|nr:NADH deshydrogenase subunit 5 [Staphylinidae sp. 2 EF-2015]
MFSINLFLESLYFIIKDLSIMLEFNLFSLNSSMVSMTILIDYKTLLFMSFVLFISSMVVYYSKEYMDSEKNLNRFIMLVLMFVLSMMFLIISPNMISILLGWDGLGLVSYCLVIYYQNIKSFSAGMLTALMNRIGDVMFLMSIAWMLNYGSWNFIFYLEFMKNDYIMQLISFMMVIAAFTKSAQIPFSSWLPAAMAAPTPVSSLVHSSTLVTAGVYLLIRFNLALSENLLLLLLFIGSLTMFMAGMGANFEFDFKKIIALSTLSQLGLMMSILSLGEINLVFFHLLTHALFKATLFMCAGVIIHNFCNCQDIRFMGNLVSILPLTSSIFIISNLALCGIPFLSGFYSKDLILEILSMNYLNLYIYLIFFISTGLTVSYTFRLIYYVLIGNFNYLSFFLVYESSEIMLKSMLSLIFMVIVGGSMLMWIILSTPYFICLPFLMKLMALLVTLIGGVLGVVLSNISLNNNSMKNILLNSYLGSMWNMPIISTLGMNYYFLFIGLISVARIDQGWSEYFGSQNIYFNFLKTSQFMMMIFNNNLKIFFLLIILMIFFLLFMIYLSSLKSV